MYAAFLVKGLCQHSPICSYTFMLIYTDRVVYMRSQPVHQKQFKSHPITNATAIRRKLGFSILPKDTSNVEEPGIKPPTFSKVDDLLYLLSLSCHYVCA